VIVGQIRNKSQQTTNITYKIDDGTGEIEVKQWLDETSRDSMESDSKLEQDAYVKAFGRLRSFNNKRHVGANFVRPVEDKNEISHHLLDATLVHLHFTRGPLGAKPGANADKRVGDGDAMETSYNHQNGGSELNNVSVTARRVYQALKDTPQSNEGVNIQEVARVMRMDIQQVHKAGQELLEYGHIYTTVDDDTWAVLNTF
jgi:replication factor A2